MSEKKESLWKMYEHHLCIYTYKEKNSFLCFKSWCLIVSFIVIENPLKRRMNTNKKNLNTIRKLLQEVRWWDFDSIFPFQTLSDYKKKNENTFHKTLKVHSFTSFSMEKIIELMKKKSTMKFGWVFKQKKTTFFVKGTFSKDYVYQWKNIFILV